MPPKKTVEETYKQLSEIDHVLLRPDSFVGSPQKVVEDMFLVEHQENEKKPKMVFQKVAIVPAAMKVVDEVITNAADHAYRTYNPKNGEEKPIPVSKIKISVNKETNTVEVWNDGSGIPVEWHNGSKCYVPEMIFGRMRTGSNYDDSEGERFVGGRNGLGAKLTNIYSLKFTIETADGKKKFKQTFSENMKKKSKEKISDCDKNYTKISFVLDFSRFDGLDGIDNYFESLIETRAYSISASTPDKVSVSYNGRVVPVKKFQDYVNLFIGGPKDGQKRFSESNNDGTWDVALTTSKDGFRQASLVNSIDTYRGGKHIDYIYFQIQKRIMEMAEKKKDFDKSTIRPNSIKERLFIFVNCRINQPTFSSQTKEEMTLAASKFGTSMKLSDKTVDGISKEIFNDIVELAEFRQQKKLEKNSDGAKTSRLYDIPKLEDATKAGTREAHKCTLILTEGDSAASRAIGSLSEIGREYFGVFPLRGKLINVKTSEKKGLENTEVNTIKQILGLRQNKKYSSETIRELRYGRILIMTDQDLDGFHIRGLIMNLFHTWWPELLQEEGFMCSLATPIVKATKGKEVKAFYNLSEFNQWYETAQGNWKVKYYKGIGTSSKEEGKEYFKNLKDNMITYTWTNDSDDAMQLAFDKGRANDRKEWLQGFDPKITFLDSKDRKVSLRRFVDRELIGFSSYDNSRSIGHVMDGLKPSTRKILYACFNSKAASEEFKVAQLGAKTAEMTAYHHGEQSLAGAIVAMAQNFIGSNNINLLKPVGQFGTRLKGGDDASSPRYIFTRLENITKIIYNMMDNPVLNFQNEEGESIEPDMYFPIVPMALVNGISGIGTGWSTDVASFNPDDLVNRLETWIRTKDLSKVEPLIPWVRNFVGTISGENETMNPPFKFHGLWKRIASNKIHVTELPPGIWIQTYKEFLESHLVDKKDKTKKKFHLTDYVNKSTDETVSFILEFVSPQEIDSMIERGTLEEDLHLAKTGKAWNFGNMNLFDSNGMIRHYNSPLEILREYAECRLAKYGERREYYLKRWQRDYDILLWKIKFIQAVNSKKITVGNKSKDQLYSELETTGFPKFSTEEGGKPGYDYLLSMRIWALTKEKILDLEKEMEKKKQQLEYYKTSSPEKLWLDELDEFKKEYKKFLAENPREDINVVAMDIDQTENSSSKKKRKRETNVVKKPIKKLKI